MNATPTEPTGEDAVLADAHAAWTTGDRPRAIATLTAFAATAPAAAKVWARLGAYGLEAARNDDALAWLKNALALAPGDVPSWNNLGTAWLRLARPDDAINALQHALALDASAIAVHVNLGNALQQAGDIDGAVAALETARGLQPEYPEVLNNLGNLYKEQGRLEAALAAYEGALRALPTFRPAFSNLLAATKLSLRHSPADIFAMHRAYAAHFEHESRAGYVPARNTPDAERRLRVGYISPDCHTALPAFVEPVLRNHDRTRFEVFAYFNNPQPPAALDRLGAVTARVMRGVDDGTVAQWIRADGIDVLIDIAGHTGHNRLAVFGRKPAPVQFTWLDYLNTTGLDAVDYRLTDAVSDPPGASDALHSEALVRLSPAQWCWNSSADIEAPGPLPMLAAGYPTLGSFNHGSKLTDSTLALWSRLLTAIPEARLVIVGVPTGSAQARVRAAFGQMEGRVRVFARVGSEEFRQRVRAVDMALDPRPFSGATTTLEMLAQGVPVVTLPGATSPSRSTASLLTALRLDDWIARNDDDYIAIAQRALADPVVLGGLRSELPMRLRQSLLCDAPAFARALERALRDAWRTWCARKAGAGVVADTALAPTSTRAALGRIDGDARAARIDAALRAGNGASVVDDACALIDEFPEWQMAHRVYLQALLEWSRGRPDLVRQMFPPPEGPKRTPRISAVICSIDTRKFATVTASFRQRFAGHSLEIVGVHDATSLAEAYNRAAAKASGDLLVFCHDDIEIVTSDFAARLVAHLERYDGVGVAGASRITGPRWGHAGQRYCHGHILHPPPPNRTGVLLMASGFQQPVCERIRGLDGVFIAVRREVWETHRFDADRYDGFHLYDLDFTWRASGAGARLAVPLDLTLFHRSAGRYDVAWQRYAARFSAQAGLDPMAAPRAGGLQPRVETLPQIDALRAAMLHFGFGAPVGG